MGNSNANIAIMMKAVNTFNRNGPCVVELKDGTDINALFIVENNMTHGPSSINGFIVCMMEKGELQKISYDKIKDIK